MLVEVICILQTRIICWLLLLPHPKPPKHSKSYYNFICDRKFTLEIGRGCAIQPVSPLLLTLAPLCNFFSSVLCSAVHYVNIWAKCVQFRYLYAICEILGPCMQFLLPLCAIFTPLCAIFTPHSLQFLLDCVQTHVPAFCFQTQINDSSARPWFVSKKMLLDFQRIWAKKSFSWKWYFALVYVCGEYPSITTFNTNGTIGNKQ